MQLKVVPVHPALAALLKTGRKAKGTNILSHQAPIDYQIEHATNSMANLMTVLAYEESAVVVLMSLCGLMTIERILIASPKQSTLPAQYGSEVCHTSHFIFWR